MREGTTLGAYRLLSELGSGGMGTVHLAQVEGDVPGLRIGDRVALKVFHPHLVTDFEMLGRFIQEVDLGKRIRHENVVRTLDAGFDVQPGGESVFLVMEYVRGRTLAEMLAAQGALSEGLCRRVARAAARGLAGIHAQHVVHADLKPENLLVTRDEVVKIMDLGLAHIRGRVLAAPAARSFSGTVLYAAPEQFGDDVTGVDGRADLYALGIAIYELAGGGNPFRHDDYRVVIQRQIEMTPTPLSEVVPGVSPFLAAVVARLLAKDPGERFRSAEDLFATLERGEDSRWWRRRSTRSRNAAALRWLGADRETALQGRNAEIVRLREALSDARAGRGRAVLIIGERGVGKTRLIDGFVRALDLLNEDVDVYVEAATEAPGNAASVVIFEDLADADSDKRAAFEALARAAPDRKLLVIGTSRHAMDRTWRAELVALPHVSEVVLERLSHDALSELLEEALETGVPSAGLARDVHATSAGHPLAALEILKQLRQKDFLRRESSGAWEATVDPSTVPLPGAVSALHRLRLAGLEGTDRDLLDVAACCGPHLDPELLAELTGESPTAVLRRLGRLEKQYRALRRDGERFTFHSPTFQQHVLGEQPEILRTEYHRLIGEALVARGAPAAAICRHLLLGDAGGAAAAHLDDALAALDGAGDARALLELTERAVATARLDELQRTRVSAYRALALHRLGRGEDCEASLRALLDELRPNCDEVHD